MIKIFVLVNGMTVVGELSEKVGVQGKTFIENPALLQIEPNEDGTGARIQLPPMMYFGDESETTVELNNESIIYSYNPRQDIINAYNKVYGSGIEVVSQMPTQ